MQVCYKHNNSYLAEGVVKMSHKIKNKVYLPNVQELILVDGELKMGTHGTPGTGVTQEKLSTLLVTEELIIAADQIITDTGGADGGYGALTLITLPASHIVLLGAFVDVTLTGDGTSIAADAAVDIGVGTAAEAANSTIDGTAADVVAKIDIALTTSVGTGDGAGLPSGTPVPIDATAGTVKLYFNIGVPDADISAEGTISIAGTVRLIYLDISKGA